jgi:cyclic pyranopterin phosphate synthase
MTLHDPTSLPASALRDTRRRPLRDLRISVTDRCNFRCTYCMPAEIFGERYEFLPRTEILTFEEIERLARLFVGCGVNKIRITGGEPLLRHELPDLLGRIASLDGLEDLALTTNASLLARHAEALKAAGLRRVTVSLDSLDPDVFHQMNGGKLSLARVLDGIAAAERAGLTPIKINCVVQKGVNEQGIVDLARHFRGTGHIVRFIEFMDVGTRNGWNLDQVVSAREIAERIGAVLPIEPIDPNYRGEVAERWRHTDGSGEIGVIASVTRPFCGSCTRARLTTEGKLVTCLFASGGTDLRAPLREGASDQELRGIIERVWTRRADAYSEERSRLVQGGGEVDTQSGTGRVEMYQIGG